MWDLASNGIAVLLTFLREEEKIAFDTFLSWSSRFIFFWLFWSSLTGFSGYVLEMESTQRKSSTRSQNDTSKHHSLCRSTMSREILQAFLEITTNRLPSSLSQSSQNRRSDFLALISWNTLVIHSWNYLWLCNRFCQSVVESYGKDIVSLSSDTNDNLNAICAALDLCSPSKDQLIFRKNWTFFPVFALWSIKLQK